MSISIDMKGKVALVTGAASGLGRAAALKLAKAGADLYLADVNPGGLAETAGEARAMGVRGIIVGALASKERRDFLASERRQRAALHRLPPFAVLVLEGALRRPLASPVAEVLAALVGREVAIVTDPPALAFEDTDVALPTPPPGRSSTPTCPP